MPFVPPIVWVHDYHLMLAANTIRDICDEENLEIRMGFFLHIPFPSFDIIRIFPWVDEILMGMLGENKCNITLFLYIIAVVPLKVSSIFKFDIKAYLKFLLKEAKSFYSTF